tara:strand:+ start:168 stop:302 length:135 start_codon:yes stop_codon:yes gene_type:complete
VRIVLIQIVGAEVPVARPAAEVIGINVTEQLKAFTEDIAVFLTM